MARLPRVTLPGHLHYIVQRGNNRQAVFIDPEDCETFLALLAESAQRHALAVHAYVLLGNEFQLLATPAAADALPLAMQAVGRRYVQYFNRRHQRSGTLWEGRYRCAVIQPERHLLPCMVAMDWAPVAAGLAQQPGGHAWSSHQHYLGHRQDRLLTPHALYWALGNTPFAREAAYAGRAEQGIGSLERGQLWAAALGGWALGDADFVDALQARTDRRLSRGQAGRPRKIPISD